MNPGAAVGGGVVWCGKGTAAGEEGPVGVGSVPKDGGRLGGVKKGT